MADLYETTVDPTLRFKVYVDQSPEARAQRVLDGKTPEDYHASAVHHSKGAKDWAYAYNVYTERFYRDLAKSECRDDLRWMGVWGLMWLLSKE